MELLFVHGALVRDGAWWWEPTATLLEARTGVRSRAVTLPSCGETPSGRPEGGLAEDAAALRIALDDADGEVVVVAHSYGGTVVAEAGAHPAVAHLVLVSSYLPDVGLSQGAIMADEADPVVVAVDGDGTVAVDGYDATSFGARFLQDADEGTQREAWSRVTRQSVAAFAAPTTAAGWQGVDTTYVVCVEDRSTSLALQRGYAARASRTVELPTGHHPFISRPDLVVDVLEGPVGAPDRRS